MLNRARNLLLLSAALVFGLPSGYCTPGSKAPTLPQIKGAHNLPQPPPGSELLHIALGFGLQNYSCPSIGHPPIATGALAMLYDITALYPGQSRLSLSHQAFDGLPCRAIWSHIVPLNLNYSTAGRVEPSSPGASQTHPFPDNGPLQIWGLQPLPFLGHHLFTSTGVANFILADGATNLLANKLAAVDAPDQADKGPQGTGAVAWLQLDAQHGSVGRAKYVYRVLTVGGAPHGCARAAGQDSTTYTAMYWFFS
ncbi:hypothetical protein E4U55_001480 [Claviceps digitariae]|nr:hypothetical protein E4U55_001480 [Claviceps digitariae]